MATKSQFINRPWIGWYIDADVLEIETVTNNSNDGAAFDTNGPHGLVANDNVQFINIKTRMSSTVFGKQGDNLKAYKSLGYKGRRPVAAAEGIISLVSDVFWFGAQEIPFSGDGRGFVVKPIFRSDWVAAFNPVNYEFVRGDDNVTAITAISPFTLQLGTLASGDFPAARQVHFREAYRNDGVFTVASASGTPALVVMNESIPVKENDFGLIVVDELNVNYRLEVEVFRIDIDGVDDDENLTPNALIFQSPQNGEINIDISVILASQFDYTNDYPLTIDTEGIIDDHKRYIKFYIKTLEKWDGSSEVQLSDASIFSGLACAASLDQDSRYGSNMADYVINTDRPANSGLFLTTMERPAIWKDWPFTIHFIWDDASNAGQATLEEQDAVGGVLATNLSDLTTDQSFARWSVQTDSFNAAAVQGDLFVQEGGTELSVRLPVDILEPCENPVMLEWVNSKGGDCFWLFDFNHERTVQAENIQEILKAALNYFTDEERYTQTGGERLVELTLFANQALPENWEALSEIVHSPRVNMITQIGTTASFKKTSIRVISRALTRDVKDARYNFQVVVGLPRREAQK